MIRFLGRTRVLDALAMVGFARAIWQRTRRPVREAKSARADFYREAWEAAAENMHGAVRRLTKDLLEITLAGQRIRVYRNYTPLDNPLTLRLAGDKTLVLSLLRDAKLPVTAHRAFRPGNIGDAIEFLDCAEGPCVVKPAGGTGGGQGVTTGIEKYSQLVLAATSTGVLPTQPLLIEREVPGENYRLLYLDGVLLDAVLRRSPGVTGDGVTSVRKLIQAANADRLRSGYAVAQTVLEIDRDLRLTLSRAGLSLDHVPPAGVEVKLKTAINSNTADENESVLHRICPAIVQSGARAAEVVGARLAGVDIITTDLSLPLEETGGVILEVNTTPGFHYHYHKKGPPLAVAEHVLQAALAPHSPNRKC